MIDKPRYITKDIGEKVNLEIQAALWKIYDIIIEQRMGQMDYLQVFEIQVHDKNLIINNMQERPPHQLEVIISGSMEGVNKMVIWIIDDSSSQTMLFPNDY